MAKEKHRKADAVKADITKVIEISVFTIGSKQLNLVRKNGHYDCYAVNFSVNFTLNQMNMVEEAVNL